MMHRWTIDPIAGPLVIAAIVGALVLLLFLRPTFGKIAAGRLVTLKVLRGAVVAMLLLAMLRPGCVTTVERPQTAVLPLLIDATRSMQLPHESAGLSRWDRVRQMLDANADAVAALAQRRIEVRPFLFDVNARSTQIENGKVAVPTSPEGSQTDMASAIADVLRRTREQRLLGMMLVGDGVQNIIDPEIELAQAMSMVADHQIPLYTIPVGQVAEAGQTADIAVTNMPDQYSVWARNNLRVTATIQARGFANTAIPVQLFVVDNQGNEQLVDTQEVAFRLDSEQRPVNFDFTAGDPGNYRILVRVEPQPRESTTRNNELAAFLTVHEGGLRVLYLYGGLSFEQKFLRQSLGSFPDIQLDFVRIDARAQRPWAQLRQALAEREYDVYMFGNVDSRSLFEPGIQEEILQTIAQRVAEGKGLIMMGGHHSFGPGRYYDTPLADLLPIRMEPTERQDFNAPVRRDLHIHRALRMRPAARHFITRLGETDAQQIWEQLPPLREGANRFLGLKPNAEVLLEAHTGDPMLIAAHVGGRVLAFAGDSTYLWWMHGFDQQHRRFWRQIILWLAFRDGLSGDNLWIDLPQRRFESGTSLTFATGVSSLADTQMRDVQLSAQLTAPDGTVSELPLGLLEGQNYQGRITRDQLNIGGIYRIDVVGRDQGATLGSASAEFMVIDHDRELAVIGADPDQLARMAETSSAWGGRMVEPAEFGQLLQQIASETPPLQVEVPLKWQIGDTMQDALIFVVLFVGLIGTEWFLRKRWGLV